MIVNFFEKKKIAYVLSILILLLLVVIDKHPYEELTEQLMRYALWQDGARASNNWVVSGNSMSFFEWNEFNFALIRQTYDVWQANVGK